MSKTHLTVGELARYLYDCLDTGLLKPEEPIIILENYSESCYDSGSYVDFFEGMKKCNLAGVVYSDYENERGFVMSFSCENPKCSLKKAIKESPTSWNRVLLEMNFEKELPKNEK